MNLISCSNYEQLSAKAAAILVQELQKIISQKGTAVIALPGGRSVTGLLGELSSEDVDWSKVEIFMIDERVVPIDDKESNYRQAYDLFLKRVKAKALPFLQEKGVEQYNLEFLRVGAHFDIIILGVGEDGHVAALFPGHPTLEVRGKKFIQINDSPKPPKERITASPDIIKDADKVIVIFSSASKKNAYKQFVNPKIRVNECPAKIALQAKKLYAFTEFS